MKAFTSIEQSKKLAEILPLESADMYLTNSSIKGEMYIDEFKPALVPYLRAKDSLDAYSKIVNNMIAWEVIPCWSIAALLSILKPINGNTYTIYGTLDGGAMITFEEVTCAFHEKEIIDAVYRMVLWLNEQNML